MKRPAKSADAGFMSKAGGPSREPQNPWKTPECLSPERVTQLGKFVFALQKTGNTFADCCDAAFGNPESYRKKVCDVLRAAMYHSVLRVNFKEELDYGDELRHRFDLKEVVVIRSEADRRDSPDDHGSSSADRLGLESARVFLRTVRDLFVREKLDEVHIGLAGGQSIGRLIERIRDVVPEEEKWLREYRSQIHLWTLSVGHSDDHYEWQPLKHAVALGTLLDLPQTANHVLLGPIRFADGDAFRAFCERPSVVEHVEGARKSVNIALTSPGAGEDNHCMRLILDFVKDREQFLRECPGEILYHPIDQDGKPMTYGEANLFTVFADDFVPSKMGRSATNPFLSFGFIYGSESGKPELKAQALYSSIRNPEYRWYTHIVCSVEIAREVIRLDDEANAIATLA